MAIAPRVQLVSGCTRLQPLRVGQYPNDLHQILAWESFEAFERHSIVHRDELAEFTHLGASIRKIAQRYSSRHPGSKTRVRASLNLEEPELRAVESGDILFYKAKLEEKLGDYADFELILVTLLRVSSGLSSSPTYRHPPIALQWFLSRDSWIQYKPPIQARICELELIVRKQTYPCCGGSRCNPEVRHPRPIHYHGFRRRVAILNIHNKQVESAVFVLVGVEGSIHNIPWNNLGQGRTHYSRVSRILATAKCVSYNDCTCSSLSRSLNLERSQRL